MFSTNDLVSVGEAGLPILEVYLQALRSSRAAATFFTVWLLFVYFGATMACVVTTGRLVWAFARDDGMPFSSILAKTHAKLQVPANATLFTAVFCILYGLIYIGSTTAFNSFIAMSILGLNVTYAIPQAVLLARRLSRLSKPSKGDILPARHFNLGPYFGPFCNTFATLWVLFYTVIFCFPTFYPTTVDTMNYVSIVVAASGIWIALVWWVGGKRKSFAGPIIEGIKRAEGVSPEIGSAGGVAALQVREKTWAAAE